MKFVFSTLAGCYLLAGCVAPDVSDNLQAVQQAYQLGSIPAREALSTDVAAEKTAGLTRRLAGRLPLYEEVGQCSILVLIPVENCALVDAFDPEQVVGGATISAPALLSAPHSMRSCCRDRSLARSCCRDQRPSANERFLLDHGYA